MAQHLAGSYRRRKKKYTEKGRSVIRRAGRGERLKPRVACWPDKAACLPVSPLPRSAQAAPQQNTNRVIKQRRLQSEARALPLFGSPMCHSFSGERVTEGRKVDFFFFFKLKKKPLLVLLYNALYSAGSSRL